MGDKTFIFDINGVSKLGSLSRILSGSSNINLENGDEVIVAALKEKNTGIYKVEALKNLSKDYCSSRLKHDGAYIGLLILFSFVLFWSFVFGVMFYVGDRNPTILQISIFVVLPIFFIGRFFGLRLFGVTKRKKLDKFIKNYVKP